MLKLEASASAQQEAAAKDAADSTKMQQWPTETMDRFPQVAFFTTIAGQAAWYRMENGPKFKNGKKLAKKIENGPRPEIGKKWPKKGEKIEK